MSDWFCHALGWGCSHAPDLTRSAPEIDASHLLLAVVLVVGGMLVLGSPKR